MLSYQGLKMRFSAALTAPAEGPAPRQDPGPRAGTGRARQTPRQGQRARVQEVENHTDQDGVESAPQAGSMLFPEPPLQPKPNLSVERQPEVHPPGMIHMKARGFQSLEDILGPEDPLQECHAHLCRSDTCDARSDPIRVDTAIRLDAVVCADTGASANFVSAKTVTTLGLKVLPTNMNAVVGDGGVVKCDGRVLIHVNIQELDTTIECYVINLAPAAFDLILGDKFFTTYRAAIDYGADCLTLRDVPNHPKRVTLQVTPVPAKPPADTTTPLCSIIAAKKLHKYVGKNTPVIALFFHALEKPTETSTYDPTTLQSKLDHVPEEIRAEMTDLVTEFQDIFPDRLPSGLPPARNTSHAIPTFADSIPPLKRPYRLSQSEKEEVEKQCKELWAKGYIQPSHSPYGAPILFVPKPDGTWRMCVDYRALNKQTIPNRYPMPRIDDILDSLSHAKIFSSLDLQQAYNQIRLKEEDIPKSALPLILDYLNTEFCHLDWQMPQPHSKIKSMTLLVEC